MNKQAIVFILFLSVLASDAFAHSVSENQVAANVAPADEEGISFFKGTWQQVLDESKKQNKPIFVDAYTVWCGPCRWMALNVFTTPEVGKFYNENFINYKFDMEKGEGLAFAQKYKVTAYPTLIFLNADGEVKYRLMGRQDKDAFLLEGKKALRSSRRAEQFSHSLFERIAVMRNRSRFHVFQVC